MSKKGIWVKRDINGEEISSENLKSAQTSREIDISGNMMPCSSCQISIVSNKKIFFEENEKIIVYKNLVMDGVFYVDEFKRTSQNEYLIRSVDAIGFLQNKDFYGFESTSITLKNFIEKITEESGIEIEYPESLSDLLISSTNMKFTNCREALHQICLCVGLFATTEKSEKIILKPISFDQKKIIKNNRIIKKNTLINQKNKYKGIELERTVYLFYPPYKTEAVFLGNNSDAKGTVYFVEFEQPIKNPVLTGLEAIQISATAAKVRKTIEPSAEVPFINATVPNETTKNKHKFYAEGNPLSVNQQEVLKISNIYLYINDYYMNKMLSRLLEYSKRNVVFKCSTFIGKGTKKDKSLYGVSKYGQSVYSSNEDDSNDVSVGDYVEVENEYGEIFDGVIERERYKLTEGFIVKDIEVKGVNRIDAWNLE